MSEEFDVAIVGASLAGASAAIILGQAGYKVALIDSESFPRRKPCGEGLSSFGLKQLARLGIETSILGLPHLQYSGYCLKAGKVRATLKSPWGKSITIQRSILDAAVLEAALAYPNVIPYLARKVTDLGHGRVHIGTEQIPAKVIIVASGGGSGIVRKLACEEIRTGKSRSGVTATFRGIFLREPKFIHILMKAGHEIYCTPLAEGRLNISVLACADTPLNLRKILMSEDLLREVFDEVAFQGVLELSPQGRTRIGNVRRVCTTPSVFLAGDALEEFDPIGGMGMSHALHSGILTAQAVQKKLSGEVDDAKLSAWYRLHSKRSLAVMRSFTKISYGTLKSSVRHPFVLRLAASPAAGRLLKILTKEFV